MKLRSLHRQAIAGFAIAEMLIGSVAASIVLGGLMMGSVALQRSFSASDRLARAQGDLHRVADYMSRDIRSAATVDATATPTVLLTLTAADYYNRNGTPSNLADDVANTPSIGRYGATYGSNPVTIRYLKSGTQIVREVSKVDGATTSKSPTTIADNVQNLSVTVNAEGVATITSSAPTQYRWQKAGTQTPAISFVMASLRRNQTQ